MEPESRYTLVGAAVLAMIAMLSAALIWLSAGAASDFHFYMIHFERQSLDGLQQGSDVNMRGVKVGRVEGYELSPHNINRVDVTIRVSLNTPVSVNTTAVVSRNLVTGLARIDLVTPGTPGPELVTVPPGEKFPVIAEGTSGLTEIADTLSRVAITGESALASLDQLLGAENRETVMQTVAAVRDLAIGLDGRLDRAKARLRGRPPPGRRLARHRRAQPGAFPRHLLQPHNGQVEVTRGNLCLQVGQCRTEAGDRD